MPLQTELQATRPAALLQSMLELTKPRITVMVVLTAVLGAFVGSRGRLDSGAVWLVLGTWFLASGASALNMFLERDADGRMMRTAQRPLPAGRISPESVLLLASVLSVAGMAALLYGTNALTTWLGALTLLSYVLVYTPLKRVTSWATHVGAIPGALPPVMGFAAATGELGFGAMTLFAILFFWQLPHFFAIAWLYREDYARAHMPMLAVGEHAERRTVRQTLVFSLALVASSILPFALEMAGLVYLVAAVGLGLAFLRHTLGFVRDCGAQTARRLMLSSVIYLPLLLAALALDQWL